MAPEGRFQIGDSSATGGSVSAWMAEFDKIGHRHASDAAKNSEHVNHKENVDISHKVGDHGHGQIEQAHSVSDSQTSNTEHPPASIDTPLIGSGYGEHAAQAPTESAGHDLTEAPAPWYSGLNDPYNTAEWPAVSGGSSSSWYSDASDPIALPDTADQFPYTPADANMTDGLTGMAVTADLPLDTPTVTADTYTSADANMTDGLTGMAVTADLPLDIPTVIADNYTSADANMTDGLTGMAVTADLPLDIPTVTADVTSDSAIGAQTTESQTATTETTGSLRDGLEYAGLAASGVGLATDWIQSLADKTANTIFGSGSADKAAFHEFTGPIGKITGIAGVVDGVVQASNSDASTTNRVLGGLGAASDAVGLAEEFAPSIAAGGSSGLNASVIGAEALEATGAWGTAGAALGSGAAVVGAGLAGYAFGQMLAEHTQIDEFMGKTLYDSIGPNFGQWLDRTFSTNQVQPEQSLEPVALNADELRITPSNANMATAEGNSVHVEAPGTDQSNFTAGDANMTDSRTGQAVNLSSSDNISSINSANTTESPILSNRSETSDISSSDQGSSVESSIAASSDIGAS